MSAWLEKTSGHFPCIKAARTPAQKLGVEHQNVSYEKEPKNIAGQIRPGTLVAGTKWLFAREGIVDQFDCLVVDEAGQVATSDIIAISRSAKNLVLLGDQMQLGQPTKGAHPGESGSSSLEYLLEGRPTISPAMGVFLRDTYRLHPEICELISTAIYDGRLRPKEHTGHRIIRLPKSGGNLVRKEAGLVFVGVDHEGNRQGSLEEVEIVQKLVAELTGRTRTDENGKDVGPVTLEDILFVAPYNLQVRHLQDVLGPDARVGSVDKFQGQEAPIVILSMGSSDADSSPRGLSFLLNKNRLNVALSRAQSLAIVVASPRLAHPRCTSPEQMKMANLMCRLIESGTSF